MGNKEGKEEGIQKQDLVKTLFENIQKGDRLHIEPEKWSLLNGTSDIPSTEVPKIKILSIDGGGIIGLIPAILIAKIEEQVQKPAKEIFDVIVGTSIGGILATGLSVGVPAAQLVQLFLEKGDSIFADGFGRNYDPKHLYIELEKILKEKTFSDVKDVDFGVETCVLHNDAGDATGMCMNNWKEPWAQTKLVDACMATSAAPAYFDAYKIPIAGKDAYIVDGGVTMNNPAMLGHIRGSFLVKNPKEELFMASLACGGKVSNLQLQESYRNTLGFRDLAKFGLNGVYYAMNSQSRQVSLVLSDLYSKQDYYRWNPQAVSFEGIKMDDTDAIKQLVAIGDEIAKSDHFKEFVARLKVMPKYMKKI